jgi:hypothetical protein
VFHFADTIVDFAEREQWVIGFKVMKVPPSVKIGLFDDYRSCRSDVQTESAAPGLVNTSVI